MTSRGRSSQKRRRVLVTAMFAVLLVILAATGVLAGTVLGGADDEPATLSGPPVQVTVPSGVSARDVAALLESNGIVESAGSFLARLEARGSSDKLKPGTYLFTPGEDLNSIAEKLETGAVEQRRVTLPEGLSIGQVATKLDEDGIVNGKEYERLARQPADFTVPTLAGTKPKLQSLEGLLFPNTYFLAVGDEAQKLIALQLAAFAKQTKDLPWSNTKELGITPYQAVIVASLIEKEARVAEERAKVAAVIYNRLRRDMPLGIDATIRYFTGKWTGPLTASDLEKDSPYNTRKQAGLPPGPIASPGLAALEAALKPADVGYLYYVLMDDQGHHFFTDSYEEFLKAKERSTALGQS